MSDFTSGADFKAHIALCPSCREPFQKNQVWQKLCLTCYLDKKGKPATSCIVVSTDAPVKQTGKRLSECDGAVLEFLTDRTLTAPQFTRPLIDFLTLN